MPSRGPRAPLAADVPVLPDLETVDLAVLLIGRGPIEIEIGPGRGMFLVERATACPEARLLGIEVRRKWASVVDERLRRLGFAERARVVCDDARQALPRLGPPGSVATVFLHFPDPWWKKRHHKRMVVSDPLLDAVTRLLADGGELFLQTDVAERAEQYQRALELRLELEPAGDEPGSPRLAANPYLAKSNRERRVEADGLPVHRLRFRRVRRPATSTR
jgi:tRNA (guanine-N7-)-methyltransferase